MPASTSATSVFQANPLGGMTPPIFGPSFLGNLWFVNEGNGLDGNIGSQPAQPFKTIAGALAHVVAGNNDVIFLTGTVHLSATLLWNANNTHLIGTDAPGLVSQRARLSSTGAAAINPLVHVTGSGCLFANMDVFNGIGAGTTATCWQDSGQRNVYQRVNFQGFGSTQSAGATGSRALLIDGGSGQTSPTTGNGEMLFEDCILGADTIARGVANSTLEIQNGSPRNIFRRCVFTMDASAATPLHMTLGAGAIDRFLTFNDCIFINAIKSGATTINQCFNINGAPGGLVLIKSSVSVGATKFETSPSNAVFIDMPVPSAGSGGLAINNT